MPGGVEEVYRSSVVVGVGGGVHVAGGIPVAINFYGEVVIDDGEGATYDPVDVEFAAKISVGREGGITAGDVAWAV